MDGPDMKNSLQSIPRYVALEFCIPLDGFGSASQKLAMVLVPFVCAGGSGFPTLPRFFGKVGIREQCGVRLPLTTHMTARLELNRESCWSLYEPAARTHTHTHTHTSRIIHARLRGLSCACFDRYRIRATGLFVSLAR